MMQRVKNEEPEKKLSTVELAVKYAEAWKQLDAFLVEPYLDPDFHYASDGEWNEISSRAEYMEYFTTQLNAYSRNGIQPEITIGRNHQTEQVCLLISSDSKSALVLETRDGRILSARMQHPDRKFKPFNPNDELYMVHGDHLDAIVPAKNLIQEFLSDIIQTSQFWKGAHTQVTTEDLYEEETAVFSLAFDDEGDMQLLTILAYNKHQETNQFLSIYPVCKGVPVEVTINKVMEWDNQVEATICCSVGEIEFAFFAVDYYCNKPKYKVGQTLTIDLAALAMRAKEALRSFQLEGEEAIDWLTRTGQTPTYDENGKVEPVTIHLGNLVAFLDTDSKCPDEAEFQSPVGPIETTSILGIDFFKTMIIISRRNTEEEKLTVSVPLYFRQDFFPAVQENDPVSGYLWVTGSIAGQHEQEKDFHATGM